MKAAKVLKVKATKLEKVLVVELPVMAKETAKAKVCQSSSIPMKVGAKLISKLLILLRKG